MDKKKEDAKGVKTSSLRGRRRGNHERRRPVVAITVVDVVRVELEPAVVDVQARRVAEVAVRVRSPLGTGAVREERIIRETLPIANTTTEVRECVRRDMELESCHVAARRTDTVSREERTGLVRKHEHVARGLCIELRQPLRGEREQAQVFGADLPPEIVLEARVQFLEDAEDVLQRDVRDVPALLRLLQALRGRVELRNDEETAVCILRKNELTPFSMRRPHVIALREFLDVTEVDAGKEWLEDIPTLESGLGRPSGRVGQVRTTAPLLFRRTTVVAGVHDDDAVRLFGGTAALGLVGRRRLEVSAQCVQHHARENGLLVGLDEINLFGRHARLVESTIEGIQLSCSDREQLRHVATPSFPTRIHPCRRGTSDIASIAWSEFPY